MALRTGSPAFSTGKLNCEHLRDRFGPSRVKSLRICRISQSAAPAFGGFNFGIVLKVKGVTTSAAHLISGLASLFTVSGCQFEIKVDSDFTRSLKSGPYVRTFHRSTTLLGSDTGIPVIAEGVESDHQLQVPRESGCRKGQGILFGKHLLPSQMQRNPISFEETGSGSINLA